MTAMSAMDFEAGGGCADGTSEDWVCVRTVSDAPQNLLKHRHLRTHIEEYRCGAKSLSGTALVRVSVRSCERHDSISQRARSTTPTSLRF